MRFLYFSKYLAYVKHSNFLLYICYSASYSVLIGRSMTAEQLKNVYGINQLYRGIIDDLLKSVNGAFLADGADSGVLQELKLLWETKIKQSGALVIDEEKQCDIVGWNQNIAPTITSIRQTRNNMRTNRKCIALENNNPQMPHSSAQVHLPYIIKREAENTQNSVFMPDSKTWKVVVKREPADSQLHQLDGGGPGMSDSSSEEECKNTTSGFTSDVDSAALVLQDKRDELEEDLPLNSDDDLSDEEEANTLFDSDNVVLCQFEKVTRIRGGMWKFVLKSGLMHIHGKDFAFETCTGEANW